MTDTVIIIGGGHNALVAAFYLAKGGRNPLVLERRPVVGGCAITEEIRPGFRAATLAHAFGPLRRTIVHDMHLERRGVQFVEPDPRLVALAPDGRALIFSRDTARTSDAIRALSTKDAEKYPEFCGVLGRLGAFLERLLHVTPPSIDAPSASDLWGLLRTGRGFRALGKKDAFTLLRWAPMPVADLVGEWFETGLLQASIAARGILGTAMGPWSAGTGAVLLLGAASDPLPGGSSISAIGGPGAVTRAMADAAREAGAQIRTDADVVRILANNGAATGVVLADGTEVRARTIVSAVDPRRTFLDLIDPMELEPAFIGRLRNYRIAGTMAKMNFALSALPAFRGLGGDAAAKLRGRVHIGPEIEYLERAFDASKYGAMSERPYLDIAFPSIVDPSLAPSGRHVMSVYVQYAPFHLRDARWDTRQLALADTVMRTLEEYAPGIGALVEARQVITPADLDASYGLSGGHPFHGELSIDQLFAMRPTLGWGQYKTPLRNLFLCGSGTHPGNGLTGGSGQNAAREILRAGH
jgi:phytoene dehydrogenase-like protein